MEGPGVEVAIWRELRAGLGEMLTVAFVLSNCCAAERMKVLPSSLNGRTNSDT